MPSYTLTLNRYPEGDIKETKMAEKKILVDLNLNKTN